MSGLVPTESMSDAELDTIREAAYAMAEMLARHLRGDFIDPATELPKLAKRLIAAYRAQWDGMSAIARDDVGPLPAVPHITRPVDTRPGAGKVIDA